MHSTTAEEVNMSYGQQETYLRSREWADHLQAWAKERN
jgi:hypothetical protein